MYAAHKAAGGMTSVYRQIGIGCERLFRKLVSAELFYAEMLSALGFESIECRPIRKRNSKKELIEFDVTAIWPAA